MTDPLRERFERAREIAGRKPFSSRIEAGEVARLAVRAGRARLAAEVFTWLGGVLRPDTRDRALGAYENALLAVRLVLGEVRDGQWRIWEDRPKDYVAEPLAGPTDGYDAPVVLAGKGVDAFRELAIELLITTGSIYLELGQGARARQRFDMAIDRAQTAGLAVHEARARIQRANLDRLADRHADALAAIDAAMALLTPGLHDPDRVEGFAARAAVHRAADRLEAAETDLQRALALADRSALRDVRLSLAGVRLDRGRLDDAAAAIDPLLPPNGWGGAPIPARLWRAARLLGDLDRARGRFDRAAGWYAQALSGAQRSLGGIAFDETRVTVTQTLEPLREALVVCRIRAGQLRRALHAVDAGRGIAFRALAAHRRGTAPTGVLVEPEMGPIQIGPATGPPTGGALLGHAAPPPARAPLTRVVYQVTADETLVFVATADGQVELRTAALGHTELERQIAELRRRFGVGSARFARPAGRRARPRGVDTILDHLAAHLLHPVEPLLPGDEAPVVVELHGPLWRLPFAALPDTTGRAVGLRWPLVHSPATTVLDDLRAQPDFAARRAWQALRARAGSDAPVVGPESNPEPAPDDRGVVLVVGDPAMPEHDAYVLEPLPGAGRESAGVAAMFERAVHLTGTEATRAAVLAALPDASVVHLATHGAAEDDPRAAWLALAADGHTNGLWTVDDVIAVPIEADLVVLSACQTGLGTVTADGVIGLARAFLVAGARSVVVSGWRVDDEATAELMTAFHAARVAGQGTAWALRAAKRAVYESGRTHPALWAPFTLIGAED